MPEKLLLFICVVALTRTGAGADFYVSPAGHDAWSGVVAENTPDRKDGPFRSLERARLAVRELKSREPRRARPIVVQLRGGLYEMVETVVFTPDDSGTEQAPVVYEAFAGERPLLSGGRRLQGWRADSAGRWRLTLEEVKRGAWSFSQLFVDGQRRYRPKRPASGWYRVAGELPPSEAAKQKGHDRFRFGDQDIRPEWARSDVEVLAVHIWSASRLRVASVDAKENAVSFTGTTRGLDAWVAFKSGYRYRVENVKEALGAPGEWYLERSTGELIYVPRPEESVERAEVIAPRLERLLVFEGALPAKRWVEHLTFRGLTFAHTNWNAPPEGVSFPQAEAHLSAAIEGVGARDVVFESCAVLHTGAYAVALGAGCREDRLERCELVDLGGGGVKIGQAGGAASWNTGQPRSDEPDSHVSHILVRDCTIASGGRLHVAAVGVWIGHASHIVIDHNDIDDFYYTGVSVGWVWGYSESLAHHNEIAHNHIRRIGQGVLSDMAGVYTLGVSPGTTVHHNRIHEVDAFDYGGWGLYTDEGSSGIVLEKNLVHDVKTGGFHQHYGRENVVKNNIFAFSRQHQIQRSRAEPHLSFTFERNIVYWDGDGPLLGSVWDDNQFRLDGIVYWHAGKPVTFPGGLDLRAWQENRGQDRRSLVVDPLFVDADRRDFRLRQGSPAVQLGFEPWDLNDVGRRSSLVLTASLPPVPRSFGE